MLHELLEKIINSNLPISIITINNNFFNFLKFTKSITKSKSNK